MLRSRLPSTAEQEGFKREKSKTHFSEMEEVPESSHLKNKINIMDVSKKKHSKTDLDFSKPKGPKIKLSFLEPLDKEKEIEDFNPTWSRQTTEKFSQKNQKSNGDMSISDYQSKFNPFSITLKKMNFATNTIDFNRFQNNLYTSEKEFINKFRDSESLKKSIEMKKNINRYDSGILKPCSTRKIQGKESPNISKVSNFNQGISSLNTSQKRVAFDKRVKVLKFEKSPLGSSRNSRVKHTPRKRKKTEKPQYEDIFN